jgi:hypothetical protein
LTATGSYQISINQPDESEKVACEATFSGIVSYSSSIVAGGLPVQS